MGYVAVQGGIEAIEGAERLDRSLRLRGASALLTVGQIQDQLGLLVDRVVGEGGLYSPFHAALALKQTRGEPIEASFYLRAYRSTLRRIADSLPLSTGEMRVERRISSAFKTIPGGQILGSTSDYEQRILDFSLLEETEAERSAFVAAFGAAVRDSARELPAHFPKVVEILREQGLVAPPADTGAETTADVTQEAITLPAGRSARLQMLARGETGGMLALAYSSMRGYGSVHPTVAELRVGWVEVRIPHPFRPGASVSLGSLRMTEVEIVASLERVAGAQKPTLTLGYGACFGHNEMKAISMAVLDRAMQAVRPGAPAEDQEFVLLHTDGIESSGFCSHFKLPHYVTFQSDLDRARAVQSQAGAGSEGGNGKPQGPAQASQGAADGSGAGAAAGAADLPEGQG